MKNVIILFLLTIASPTDIIAQNAVLLTSVELFNMRGKVKSIQDKDILEFNESGDLTNATYFYDGSIWRIYKYIYSKPGMRTEANWFDKTNKLVEKTVYEYNSNDYEIKSVTYDNVGKKVAQRDTKYIDKHHYITNLTFTNLSKTDTITTDANFNILEKRIFDYNSKVYYRKVYSYKPGIREPYLEQEYNDKGALTLEIQNDFDDKGNSIKKISKGYGTTQITTFEYTYDAKGNYIKRIASGYDSGTIERKIEYY